MPIPNEAAHLAVLPPVLRSAIEGALLLPLTPDGRTSPKANEAIIKVFHAVNSLPANGPIPLPASLSPEQKALAYVFAGREGHGCFGSPYPRTAAVRRRWLGIDPGGVLERPVTWTHDDEPREVPLWRALSVLADEHGSRAFWALITAQKFSLADRLQLMSDIARDAYALRGELDRYEWTRLSDFKSADPAVTAWALAEVRAWKLRPSTMLLQPIFAALLAAKVPLEPAWDVLVPVEEDPKWPNLTALIATALPEERRGPALANGLRHLPTGLALLAKFPSRELAERVLELATQDGPAAKRAAVTSLAALGKSHPEIAAVVGPVAKKLSKPLVLTVTRTLAPKSLAELKPLERKQLAIAGQRYDGKKLPATTRMSKEKSDEEVSFKGLLRLRDLADASGKLAYTAFTYAVDSGAIFKAGGTKVVAEIIQFGVECEDERLCAALEVVLREKPKKPKVKSRSKVRARRA